MARIQTTHVGSLPRSKQITDLVFAREAGVPVDEPGFSRIVAGWRSPTVPSKARRSPQLSSGWLSGICQVQTEAVSSRCWPR